MKISSEKITRIAAWFGASAVAIGAFGAHGLKPHLDAYQLGIFEKGVQYQFYHTAALALCGLLLAHKPENAWFYRAAWLFSIGIFCFSGSLYLLACRDLLPFSANWAGPVTPLGGVAFIAGWIMLALGSTR